MTARDEVYILSNAYLEVVVSSGGRVISLRDIKNGCASAFYGL